LQGSDGGNDREEGGTDGQIVQPARSLSLQMGLACCLATSLLDGLLEPVGIKRLLITHRCLRLDEPTARASTGSGEPVEAARLPLSCGFDNISSF
jgi:hypothetical protein